jgi:hypothetical protein
MRHEYQALPEGCQMLLTPQYLKTPELITVHTMFKVHTTATKIIVSVRWLLFS